MTPHKQPDTIFILNKILEVAETEGASPTLINYINGYIEALGGEQPTQEDIDNA